jgi:hypothetical protein
MPFKKDNEGREVYVPRGYTLDPCPGCGEGGALKMRKRDGVCEACADAISKWRKLQAERAAKPDAVPHVLNERAHGLPYLEHEDDLRPRDFHNERAREPIRYAFWELSWHLSEPTTGDGSKWNTSDLPRVFPRTNARGFDRDEWPMVRDMNPKVANLIGTAYAEVRISLVNAYRKGVQDGRNLLLSLAEGGITNDEFNSRAARMNGENG